MKSRLFSIFTLLLANGAAATAAPTLTRFTVTPSTVDVSTGGQWVTLQLEAEDPAGIDRFGAGFDIPGRSLGRQVGQSDRVAGDAVAGTYQTDLFVPAYLPPGAYLANVTAFNSADEITAYPADALLPAGSSLALTVVNNGAVDHTPPALTSITFDPPVLVPSGGPQTVTVSISATDDTSGVRNGGITFFDTDGNYVTQGSFTELDRVAGDALSGTYAFDVTFLSVPEGPLEFGSSLILVDASELLNLVGDAEHQSPYPAGSPRLGVADTAPPAVEEITLSPSEVDVTTAGQTVTVTAQVSDPSGLGDIYLRLGESGRSLEWSMTSFDRIAGDARSGTYQMLIQIPAFLPPGDYPLTLSPRDSAGNRGTYGTTGTPFPPGSSTELTVLNAGPVDSVPPALEALRFSTSVLAPDSPATLTVTLTASDAGAGLTGGGITFWSGNAFLGAVSFDLADLVEGDPASGVFRFDVTLPQVPEGEALATDVILRDASELFSLWGDRPDRQPLPRGTVPLLVSNGPVEAFDAWLAAYPDLPTDARGFDDDPDRDGFGNGLEFVFGGDPGRFDGEIGAVAVSDPDWMSLRAVVSLENLALGTGTAVTFGAESSTDAASWQPVPLAGQEGEMLVYHHPRAGARRLFLRFSADLPGA